MTTFSAKALNAAKDWNAKHPVGTRVRVFLKDDSMEVVTHTASIATVDGDRAVVMLKQVKGFHDIEKCTPAPESQSRGQAFRAGRKGPST